MPYTIVKEYPSGFSLAKSIALKGEYRVIKNGQVVKCDVKWKCVQFIEKNQ